MHSTSSFNSSSRAQTPGGSLSTPAPGPSLVSSNSTSSVVVGKLRRHMFDSNIARLHQFFTQLTIEKLMAKQELA